MKVWLVIYEHRHGRDVSIGASREIAYRLAMDYILESIYEVEDAKARDEIKALGLKNLNEKAVQKWWKYQENPASGEPEAIEIEEIEVAS